MGKSIFGLRISSDVLIGHSVTRVFIGCLGVCIFADLGITKSISCILFTLAMYANVEIFIALYNYYQSMDDKLF